MPFELPPRILRRHARHLPELLFNLLLLLTQLFPRPYFHTVVRTAPHLFDEGISDLVVVIAQLSLKELAYVFQLVPVLLTVELKGRLQVAAVV